MKSKFTINTGAIEIPSIGVTIPNIGIDTEVEATPMKLAESWKLYKQITKELPQVFLDMIKEFSAIAPQARDFARTANLQGMDVDGDSVKPFSDPLEGAENKVCCRCGCSLDADTLRTVSSVIPSKGILNAFCCSHCFDSFSKDECRIAFAHGDIVVVETEHTVEEEYEETCMICGQPLTGTVVELGGGKAHAVCVKNRDEHKI